MIDKGKNRLYLIVGILLFLILFSIISSYLYNKYQCNKEIKRDVQGFRMALENQTEEQTIPNFESELKIRVNDTYYARLHNLPTEKITQENIDALKLQSQNEYLEILENYTQQIYRSLNESVKEYEINLRELKRC